ncbi:hypothetical protein JCM10213_007717 [Rhodosporidiobolus nylandii]
MPSFYETMLTRYADEIKVATEAPFLEKAGRHELSRETLSEWLAQDRAYALQGYPKFIAQMITALPLSSPSQQSSATSLLSLFSYALSNIHREVTFFDSLGPRFGLDLSRAPPASDGEGKLQGSRLKPLTKAYVDLLIATGAEAGRSGGGVEEGLVLLWAMEKIYLTAWLHASTFAASTTASKTDEQTSAALTELIGNWTNQEFKDFVGRCEEEVEKLQLKEGTDEWDRCEEMFKYTLWLEQRFWPAV